MASRGELDPVIGRDKEIARVIQILSRRSKNNPVLIGEPGVGKTAVAEGLAQRVAPARCRRICATSASYRSISPVCSPGQNTAATLRTG